ncbi:hypothetical protein QEN19_004331 [Hanseniaspora menglaensis]
MASGKKNSKRPTLSSNSTATESMVNLTKPTLQGLYDEDVVNEVDEDDLSKYAKKEIAKEEENTKNYSEFSLLSTSFFQRNKLGKYLILPLIKLAALVSVSIVFIELVLKLNPTLYRLENYKLHLTIGFFVYSIFPLFDSFFNSKSKPYESVTTLTKTSNAVLGLYLGLHKYSTSLESKFSSEMIMLFLTLGQATVWILFDLTKSVVIFTSIVSAAAIYLLQIENLAFALYVVNVVLASSLILGKLTRYLRLF